MAYCRKCGTLMERDVCPACGTTNAPATETPPAYTAPQQPGTPPPPAYAVPPTPPPFYGRYPQPPYYYPPQQKEPITVLGWVWRFLIPAIPGVGWIIHIIMLCIWMGDDTKDETFRNWAKAQLIVMAIAVVLVILMIFIFINLGIAVGHAIEDTMYYA